MDSNSLQPYCVVTGYHVVPHDLTICPSCRFPGFRTEFLRLASSGEPCPMCGSNLDASLLVSVTSSQLEKATKFADDESTKDGVEKNGLNGDLDDDVDDDDYESTRHTTSSHPMSATSSSSGAGSSRPGSNR